MLRITKNSLKTLVTMSLTCCIVSLTAQQVSQPKQIEAWVTMPDRSALFSKQPTTIPFANSPAVRGWGVQVPPIVIDEQLSMQTVDGFGFALTGGSAELMMKMSPAERSKLIKELISSSDDGVGISYIRVSIGASDLNSFVFSYNDLPEGETDFPLAKFDL